MSFIFKVFYILYTGLSTDFVDKAFRLNMSKKVRKSLSILGWVKNQDQKTLFFKWRMRKLSTSSN
ncbi:protein of unknown function [Legionella micdadei]|uniref:Uncharacterized protein n=1 Tax=Legionella micdadei TaxID=451 RepID=A0A098GHH4_LEGMI|nr:protein of unknown function [Legionella micdadei]